MVLEEQFNIVAIRRGKSDIPLSVILLLLLRDDILLLRDVTVACLECGNNAGKLDHPGLQPTFEHVDARPEIKCKRCLGTSNLTSSDERNYQCRR